MNIRGGPFKTIVSRRNYQTSSHPNNSWSTELTLSCGHTKVMKKSQVPKKMTRCMECHQ